MIWMFWKILLAFHTLSHLLEYKGSSNIMKGAMETSHIVTTVSPTYAKEILSLNMLMV